MRFFKEHQDNIHQVQSSISIKHFCGIKLDCNQVMPNASGHSRSSKSWNPQHAAYQWVQHQQPDRPCAADHIQHPQQHTCVIPTFRIVASLWFQALGTAQTPTVPSLKHWPQHFFLIIYILNFLRLSCNLVALQPRRPLASANLLSPHRIRSLWKGK